MGFIAGLERYQVSVYYFCQSANTTTRPPNTRGSKEYLLDLIQPDCETSLLERFFPLLPPITLVTLPSTSRLTSLLPLLPLRDDLLVFLEQTVEGYSQLFDLVDEFEFWLDLVGDGSENRVRWGVLKEGEEGGVQDRLDERYHLWAESMRYVFVLPMDALTLDNSGNCCVGPSPDAGKDAGKTPSVSSASPHFFIHDSSAWRTTTVSSTSLKFFLSATRRPDAVVS